MSPYDFGWPDSLVDIHFPKGNKPGDASQPWYFWLPVQGPVTFFQYIGSQLGGQGWQCKPFLPVIRILPIDSQKMTPTSPVGFTSLEDVIDQINQGKPISSDAFGRFNFKNKFFWKVMGRDQPSWASFKNGLPVSRKGDGHTPVKDYIESAVTSWRNGWNTEADSFNAATTAVTGQGNYAQYGPGIFTLPVPGAGVSTFPLPTIQQNPDKFYFGPIPPFVIFERGSALIWKQSFAFRYEIGQLDPAQWDMNHFPPKRVPLPASTAKTNQANGYGGTAFPLTSPIIGGTSSGALGIP